MHPRTDRVSIEDGQIIWRAEKNLEKLDKVSERRPLPASQLLDDFLALANGDQKALRTFARKYGPLGLCKHGFALGHRNRHMVRCYEVVAPEPGIRVREPVDAWWRYVSRAYGVLTVWQQLTAGRKAKEDDWSWLFDGIVKDRRNDFRLEDVVDVPKVQRLKVLDGDSPKRLWPIMTLQLGDPVAEHPLVAMLACQKRDSLKEQRELLADVLNHWLDECETGPCVTWKSDVDVRLGASDPQGIRNHLLTSIGVLLLSEVLRRQPHVRCDFCNHRFQPKKLRSDRANVCHRLKCKKDANKMRVNKSRAKSRARRVHK